MLERRSALWIGAALCLGLLACEPAVGPVPVAWDRTRCARCGMLVSEPASAAQRHTADGEIQHYDDPGCLLVSLASEPERGPQVLYFHHRSEDRWLTQAEVRFARASHTPMGYGLAAVEASDASAVLSLSDAREAALAIDRERSAPVAASGVR